MNKRREREAIERSLELIELQVCQAEADRELRRIDELAAKAEELRVA